MAISCILTYEKHRVIIAARYVEPFVEALKSDIPSGYRTWESQEKLWVIYYPWIEEARHLAKTYFGERNVEEREIHNLHFQEQAERARQERARTYERYEDMTNRAQRPQATIFSTLYVTDDAPREVVEAAYRALARLHHPDVPNGSLVTMQRVNVAYEAIKERNGW